MTRGRPVTTHCKEGHSLALHAYIASDGRRRCRLCRRRTWRSAKAAARQRRGPHAAIENATPLVSF